MEDKTSYQADAKEAKRVSGEVFKALLFFVMMIVGLLAYYVLKG